MAFDLSGNLYIADSFNDRIRKVDTNGLITTVAGAVAGATYFNVSFSGDGGPAVEAGLCTPEGVVADALGDLFIMDTGSTRVRKVDSHGIITTVAGGGPGGLGDGGPAIYATLGRASNFLNDALCLDALGNLYIADCFNQRIRKVDTNGIITTVAGNGSVPTRSSGPSPGDGGPATNAILSYPCSVAFDADGNLYIANSGTGVIRKVDTNGIITTVAGGGNAGDGGPATCASLGEPDGVVVDAAGNLYIADFMNNAIREVHFAGFPTLSITNVTASNAGSYAVVVISPYGSVTSAVATLTVQAPPVITLQPTNQTVPAGSSPTFSVAAAGSGTFEYLWYLAGTNLVQSGRSSSLTLPNVFTNNAENYTVVVINTWGSVTSAVASLTVTIPTNAPQIMTSDGCCGFLDNQFGFNLSGAYGQTIVVDGSTDLVNWTPLFTNTCVGDGGSAFYFWDACWTNFGSRFYRARLP